jgi:hypothetical protein
VTAVDAAIAKIQGRIGASCECDADEMCGVCELRAALSLPDAPAAFPEATPRPWSFACDSYGKVQHSRKACVYGTEAGNGGDRIHTVAGRIERWDDAKLIVTAVNERDSLKREVEELREALEQVEAMAVECWDCEGSGIHPRDPESTCDTCGGNGRAWEVPATALCEIRSALARSAS